MKFLKSVLLMVGLLIVVFLHAKQIGPKTVVASTPAEAPAVQPAEWVQPDIDITKLPAPLNAPVVAQPSEYVYNKVASLSQQLIQDIFPQQATIERIVFEFKDAFPGPNKGADTILLYNAIINNPEIRKFLTVKNAVSVYNFIKEAISNAWDKKDNLVWAS